MSEPTTVPGRVPVHRPVAMAKNASSHTSAASSGAANDPLGLCGSLRQSGPVAERG
ncbi:MAG: hypothetical protein R2710_10245 [Acidimicrobiales bacterium]